MDDICEIKINSQDVPFVITASFSIETPMLIICSNDNTTEMGVLCEKCLLVRQRIKP